MNSKIKYQTIEVVRSESESGLDSFQFKLDPAYKRITGLRANIVDAAGTSYSFIALKDRENTYINKSPNEILKPTVEHQFFPVDIEHRHQDFYLETTLPAAASGSDYTLEVTFRLES